VVTDGDVDSVVLAGDAVLVGVCRLVTECPSDMDTTDTG